jgi:hypothetical protein
MEDIDKMSNKILVLSVVCFSLLLAVVAPAQAVEYEYTELLPPGWISAEAIAINNKGVVVGAGTDGNQIDKMFIAIPKLSLPAKANESDYNK